MLKTRILSSIIGIILLLAVMLLPGFVFGIAFTVLAAVALYEFYNALKHAGYKPVKLIGYVSCLLLTFLSFHTAAGQGGAEAGGAYLFNVLSLSVFIMIALLFCAGIFRHDDYSLNDLSLTATGILYIVLLFSFPILIRNLAGGIYFVWLIFIGAWATDIFAYFTGTALGRTKILPVISPSKSLEGSIGGMAGSTLAMVLYGFVLDSYTSVNIPLYHFALMGVLCGLVSQLGDWAASAIKRYAGIKDYGKIMPGHGGVLDRFDSVLFVGPVIYFYLTLITA